MDKPLSKIFVNVEGFHQESGEMKSLLTEIPESISSKKQFLQIEKAENFFKDRLIKHFQIEEQNIFPYVLNKLNDYNANALIYDLRNEHNIILEQIEKFQKIIYGNVFPFNKEILDELNLILNNISYALMLHIITEDKKLFPLIKDKKIIDSLNIDMNDISVSAALQEVIQVLGLLAQSEILIAKFYNLCAENWKEESEFWLKIAQQEVHHFQNIKRMINCILRRQDKFVSNNIFKLQAVQTFVSGVEKNINEVEHGKMPHIKMISLAKDLEGSIMENKFETIVRTTDLEYNIFAKEIVEETRIHREIINTKHKYYSSKS